MTLKFNGITINSTDDVKYNGTSLSSLKLNGTTIWTKYVPPTPVVVYERSTAGGDMNWRPPQDGNYQIILVGGGCDAYSVLNNKYYGSGGGYINVYCTLSSSSSYYIMVGDRGLPGSSSTFQINVGPNLYLIAGGGQRQSTDSSNAIIGGLVYQTIANVYSYINGGSNYNGYGKGGSWRLISQQISATAGYIKIIKL